MKRSLPRCGGVGPDPGDVPEARGRRPRRSGTPATTCIRAVSRRAEALPRPAAAPASLHTMWSGRVYVPDALAAIDHPLPDPRSRASQIAIAVIDDCQTGRSSCALVRGWADDDGAAIALEGRAWPRRASSHRPGQTVADASAEASQLAREDEATGGRAVALMRHQVDIRQLVTSFTRLAEQAEICATPLPNIRRPLCTMRTGDGELSSCR